MEYYQSSSLLIYTYYCHQSHINLVEIHSLDYVSLDQLWVLLA